MHGTDILLAVDSASLLPASDRTDILLAVGSIDMLSAVDSTDILSAESLYCIDALR